MKQNTPKPIQVSCKDYSLFHRQWAMGQFGDQRLGQAIVNQFYECKEIGHPEHISPVADLFYVSNKEVNKIVHDFVEFLPVYA